MIAVDTNVFLRSIVDDDPAMAEAAARILNGPGMFVPKTVLLETHWILTSRLGMREDDATARIAEAVALDSVELEGGESTGAGVVSATQGLDFEDALHLASTPDGMSFATFDKRFAKRAARLQQRIAVVRPTIDQHE